MQDLHDLYIHKPRMKRELFRAMKNRADHLHTLYKEEGETGKQHLITEWEAKRISAQADRMMKPGYKTGKTATKKVSRKRRKVMKKETTTKTTTTVETSAPAAESKKKVQATGAVTLILTGLDAKSAKAVVDGTGAESASKDGNAYQAVFPITTDTIRAARTDGISNYGAMFGFKSNATGAHITLFGVDAGLLDTLSRLTRRSKHHLDALGLEFSIGEEDLTVTCTPIPKAGGSYTADDVVLQTTVAVLLIARAHKALNHTEHPLTYFDFLQAIGVTDGVRREEESAVTILNGLDHYIKPEKKKAEPKAKKEPGAEKKNAVKPSTKPAAVATPGAPAGSTTIGKKKTPASPPPVGDTGNIMPTPGKMSVKEKIAAARAKKEAAAAAAQTTPTN